MKSSRHRARADAGWAEAVSKDANPMVLKFACREGIGPADPGAAAGTIGLCLPRRPAENTMMTGCPAFIDGPNSGF
jgi:hypothetical protein